MTSMRKYKLMFEQRLSDQKKHLKRILSKSNSMESLDKVEVQKTKQEITRINNVINVISVAIEDEDAPSF